MDRALAKVERIAATPLPVLIYGELGSGKKRLALEIHRRSAFGGGSLTLIGLRGGRVLSPESLAASSGTLLLDGLCELAHDSQAALVERLDHQRAEIAGEPARWIVTSRVPPSRLLAEGRLREDLYLHLAVLPIRVPPLRERRDEFPQLASALLERIGRRLGRRQLRLSRSALKLLSTADWPGNLRELENCLTHAAMVAGSGHLLREHFELRSTPGSAPLAGRKLADVEREAIEQALAAVDGHRRKAAASLGIGVRTLYDKIKRYRIELSG